MTDASTSADAGNAPPNAAQAAVARLMAAHDLPCTTYNGWLLPLGQAPGLRALWTPAAQGNPLIGMLTVVTRLADRREIVEKFAGLGEGEAGLHDALLNFARGSLHPLLAGVWHRSGEDLPSAQRLMIGGHPYAVYAGGWLGRNAPTPPAALDEQLRAAVEAAPLQADLHWLRCFISQLRGQVQVEALLDNAPWPEGEALQALDWPASEHFYSLRQFIVLRREA